MMQNNTNKSKKKAEEEQEYIKLNAFISNTAIIKHSISKNGLNVEKESDNDNKNNTNDVVVKQRQKV